MSLSVKRTDPRSMPWTPLYTLYTLLFLQIRCYTVRRHRVIYIRRTDARGDNKEKQYYNGATEEAVEKLF